MKMLLLKPILIMLLLSRFCVTRLSSISFNCLRKYGSCVKNAYTNNATGSFYTQTIMDKRNNYIAAADKCETSSTVSIFNISASAIEVASILEGNHNSTTIATVYEDRSKRNSSPSEYEDAQMNGFIRRVDLSAKTFASTQKSGEDLRHFFVITAIFNPASYKSRYNLYHKFAQHMNETGAQLITIECIFPSLNQHEFQVTDSNNPFHIQLKSESIYWMKENLINIAVSRLPPHAKWVCWLDADIEFEETNWLELTLMELKKYTVVQIFEKAKFLGPPPKNEVLRVDYSFGYSVIHEKPVDLKCIKKWYPHPGYGWAMSIKDFRKINGLPDYDVVGSGDVYFAYSLIKNGVESIIEPGIFLTFQKLILNRSNFIFTTLQNISQSNSKAMVGNLKVTIRHKWHGARQYRQYNERSNILRNNNYHFFTDLTLTQNGLFRLNSAKPRLQEALLSYFHMRHEDTIETEFHPDSRKCTLLQYIFYLL